MHYPEQLKYVKTHEWIRFLDETTAQIGITDYAQDTLGDLVFVNLPEEGDEVTAGEAFGDVESVKAASDVISPVSGRVKSVNIELADNPGAINEDAYGAWFITVDNITDTDELFDAEAYAALVEEEKSRT
ncbi:MAG TPA: glycine cleavage system protein GcvH [Clostridiales bacterium]|jgi:glycine cleavage system H protein|nr:glycine cleavage system protein GcvH [Clostridiales bacterium]HCG36148.1 glycine cleavage system protein GcvH [Clostridiales bacterium]